MFMQTMELWVVSKAFLEVKLLLCSTLGLTYTTTTKKEAKWICLTSDFIKNTPEKIKQQKSGFYKLKSGFESLVFSIWWFAFALTVAHNLFDVSLRCFF